MLALAQQIYFLPWFICWSNYKLTISTQTNTKDRLIFWGAQRWYYSIMFSQRVTSITSFLDSDPICLQSNQSLVGWDWLADLELFRSNPLMLDILFDFLSLNPFKCFRRPLVILQIIVVFTQTDFPTGLKKAKNNVVGKSFCLCNSRRISFQLCHIKVWGF